MGKKIRFGRRLSSLGRGLRSSKKKTSKSDRESDKAATGLIKPCCSIESSTSSLDSNIRDHGPIDTDTNRKLRPAAGDNKPRVQSSLPKISETNDGNGSRADTPSTTDSAESHSVAPPPATAAPTPAPEKVQEESTPAEDESVAKSTETSGRTSPFVSSFASSGLAIGPSPSILGRIHNWLGSSSSYERGDSKLARETSPPSALTKDGKADSPASAADLDVSFVDKEDKYRVDPEQGNDRDRYRVDIDSAEQVVIDRDATGDARPPPEDDKYTLSPSMQMVDEAFQSIERATTIKTNFDFAASSVMNGGEATIFQSNPKSSDGSKSKAEATKFKALKKGAEKGEFERAKSPVGRPKSPAGRSRSPLTESRHDETTRSSPPVHNQPPRDQAEATIASPPPDPPGLTLGVESISSAHGAEITAKSPLTTSTNAPGQQRLSTASPLTLQKVFNSTNDSNKQLEIILDAESISFDDENNFQLNFSGSSSGSNSWDSDMSMTYSICDETQRLIDLSRDFEAKNGYLRSNSILKTSMISPVGSQSHIVGSPSDSSIRTEVVGVPSCTSSVKTEKRTEESQRKSLTWYDDKVNENKPFLLRTDESFEASTAWSGSTQRTMASQATGHMSLLDHVSDFIGKIEIGQCGGDEASYDIHEQSEI